MEDKEKFCKDLFNEEESQISSFVLDHLKPVNKYDNTPGGLSLLASDLRAFARVLDLIINQLGWIEHTGDWDPYLIIELEDGTTFETASGYYLFEVTGVTQIEIEAPGPNEDWEDINRKFWNQRDKDIIPLSKIKSIRVVR